MQQDRDGEFRPSFIRRLKRNLIKAMRKGYRSPNLNAFVERILQTLGRECLDHFLILGTKHMDHLCKQFLEHYHRERPHQSLDNEPISRPLLTKPRLTTSRSESRMFA